MPRPLNAAEDGCATCGRWVWECAMAANKDSNDLNAARAVDLDKCLLESGDCAEMCIRGQSGSALTQPQTDKNTPARYSDSSTQ